MVTVPARFNFEGNPVRIDVDAHGEPWWVLADVCHALGISNSRNVFNRLLAEEKDVRVVDTPGGPQEMQAINEPGLYRTIFRSAKDEAQRFQRWVFHEVLPSIRRTGAYTHEGPDLVPRVRETRYPDGRVVVERFVEDTAPTPVEDRPELPAPSVALKVLRKRFHEALRSELGRDRRYQRLDSDERAFRQRELNSRMKAIVGGMPRDEWKHRHYETAADWLLLAEGLDIRWALVPVTEGA